MEHATTVLAMEVAHLQNMVESKAKTRSNLVLELVAGDDGPGTVNQAQGLGYDLGRPHRVVALECQDGEDVETFCQAVAKAMTSAGAGSLLAARIRDVIVLADREVAWDRFQAAIVAERNGARCSVGVGSRCDDVTDFPRSYREAQLALQIQKSARRSRAGHALRRSGRLPGPGHYDGHVSYGQFRDRLARYPGRLRLRCTALSWSRPSASISTPAAATRPRRTPCRCTAAP